jgi:ketosteroid isomerase-like protein
MSVQEIESLTNKFFDDFSRNDMCAVASMLSDNLEVIDHVTYRLDNKQHFADNLVGAMAGIESGTFGTRQLSCRVFNDNAAVANAYDVFSGMGKNGKPINLNGRTTLVFAKEGSPWKIVSCHFSPLPTH